MGDLVGDYYDPLYNTISGGFLYADGKITSFSSDPASPSDINDLGEIVGAVGVGANQYCTSRECPEAFLYSHGVMTNLNSLLPDGSDWELLSATAINDKGQIVGFGYRPVPVPPIDPPQYVTRAFLLDTTPEPATLLLMGVGLVGLALMRRSVMHPNQDASVAACDR